MNSAAATEMSLDLFNEIATLRAENEVLRLRIEMIEAKVFKKSAKSCDAGEKVACIGCGKMCKPGRGLKIHATKNGCATVSDIDYSYKTPETPVMSEDDLTDAESVHDTVDEPVAETIAEPVAETIAEPVAETIAEPVAEPVAETIAEDSVKIAEKVVTINDVYEYVREVVRTSGRKFEDIRDNLFYEVLDNTYDQTILNCMGFVGMEIRCDLNEAQEELVQRCIWRELAAKFPDMSLKNAGLIKWYLQDQVEAGKVKYESASMQFNMYIRGPDFKKYEKLKADNDAYDQYEMMKCAYENDEIETEPKPVKKPSKWLNDVDVFAVEGYVDYLRSIIQKLKPESEEN